MDTNSSSEQAKTAREKRLYERRLPAPGKDVINVLSSDWKKGELLGAVGLSWSKVYVSVCERMDDGREKVCLVKTCVGPLNRLAKQSSLGRLWTHFGIKIDAIIII